MIHFKGFKVGFPLEDGERILQKVSFRNDGESRDEEYHQT